MNERELHREAKPLVQRITAQNQFGSHDLSDWLVELADPLQSYRVLDVGCGNGYLLFPFAQICNEVTGLDVSEDMVAAVQSKAIESGLKNVHTILAAGDEFDLGKERYEITMCNFAIYYMNVPEVISRLARFLTNEGTAYVMGSPDENAQELMQIHSRATDYVPAVYAPGYSDIRKYSAAMNQSFSSLEFHQFTNLVEFPSADFFLEYYTSTNLFRESRNHAPKLEQQVADVAKEIFETFGKITITKVVDTAVLKGPIRNVAHA